MVLESIILKIVVDIFLNLVRVQHPKQVVVDVGVVPDQELRIRRHLLNEGLCQRRMRWW